MINYADESYYKSTYLAGRAAVITTAFAYYATNATAIIKLYTGNSVDEDDVPDEVKKCCCELAEAYYRQDINASDSGVSSESVGGWSKSFESSEARGISNDKNIHDIIYKWLSGTGLLYMGV